jgi:predicted ATPase
MKPAAGRETNDRFEDRLMKPDASNLAAVLAHREETSTELRPEGVLSDIAADLCSLIPSVRRFVIQDDPNQKRYSFGLEFHDGSIFSSRVISDGTLRLLVLLAVLNDPRRCQTLCFEEPEKGFTRGVSRCL